MLELLPDFQWEQNKPLVCPPMMQNDPFLREHGAYKITATPMPSLGFQTTIETFQMR